MSSQEESQENPKKKYSKWGTCPQCGSNLHFQALRPSGSISLKCNKCKKYSSINAKTAKTRKPRKPYRHSKINGPCDCEVTPWKAGIINGQQRLQCPSCKRSWYDLSEDSE
jgi:hypothetical protein